MPISLGKNYCENIKFCRWCGTEETFSDFWWWWWWFSCWVMSNAWDSMDCSPPGSSLHGFLQARILEWVAIPVFRGSSLTRDQTQVSCIAGRFLMAWATRETHIWNTVQSDLVVMANSKEIALNVSIHKVQVHLYLVYYTH